MKGSFCDVDERRSVSQPLLFIVHFAIWEVFMVENLQMFWDFFFYPLTRIDEMGFVSDVLLMCIVVFCLFEFVMEVLEWSMNLSKR